MPAHPSTLPVSGPHLKLAALFGIACALATLALMPYMKVLTPPERRWSSSLAFSAASTVKSARRAKGGTDSTDLARSAAVTGVVFMGEPPDRTALLV